MSIKRPFVLLNADIRRRVADFALREAPDGWAAVFSEPTRNLSQNAAQWPILEAFSQQLKWPVNGEMVTMTADEWKDVLTAAFRKESVRLAMGIDGGMVMLGMRTSTMSKKEFSEWLEYLYCIAAVRGVALSAAPNER